MKTETVTEKETLHEPFPGYELTITREFNAPRELVWKAWTDPAMQKEWMGPRGFTTLELDMPQTPGARWHRVMQGRVFQTGNMVTLRQHGTVKEVKPPELLVFTFAWDSPADVGLSHLDLQENTVTIRLEAKGRKTVMTFTHGPFITSSARDGHRGGWNSSLDKFAEYLEAVQPAAETSPDDTPTELHLRRWFRAPADRVYEAFTRPEQLAMWWAPSGFSVPRCEFEAKAGGKVYLEMKAPDGVVYPMAGQVVDCLKPYRIVYKATPLDGKSEALFETWNSIYLEEKDGGTEVMLDVHVISMTDRAPMYLKGMKQGWSQSLEKLEQLL